MSTTTLPKKLSDLEPPPLPRAVLIEVESVLNVLDPDGTIPADRALTPSARAALDERIGNLARFLRAAESDEIIDDLLRMFLVLHKPKGDEMDAETRVRAYCGVLADAPPFAVKRAIADFMRGKAGDGRLAPTAPQLRREALRHVEPLNVELARIKKALDAKPRAPASAEGRKRVLAHVQETLRGLHAANLEGGMGRKVATREGTR